MAAVGNDFYQTKFDGNSYLNITIAGGDFELKWIVEDFFHHLFKDKKITGKTLIDIGSGPTVRSVISASAFVSEIYLSDLVEGNRTIVEKWVHQHPDAPDYTNEFKHVASLEGKTDYKYLEDRVRGSIKGIFHCNVLDENPLSPRPAEQFDIVTSSQCIDCIPNEKDYFSALRNLVSLLKPKGYLILVGNVRESAYRVGEYIFPTATVNEEKVKKVVVDAGLQVCNFKEHLYQKKLIVADNDSKGLFTLLAYKP